MIIIIDYDTGNTKNVQKALTYIGLESKLSADPKEILGADGLILPGVGAYRLAMQALKERQLVSIIKEAANRKIPILGVCLGMQLLLEGSTENGFSEGLGLIEGICERLPDDTGFPVPHMGWNALVISNNIPLTPLEQNQFVYFVHSYYVDCDPTVIDAWVQYSIKIPAVISKGNIYGTQFHPEKSSTVGLTILKGFKEVVENARFASN